MSGTPGAPPPFREDAVHSQTDALIGSAGVRLSLGSGVVAYLFTSLVLVGLAYLAWGSYTRRVTVSGVLRPAGDVIRVYPPHPGIVARRYVEEGESVHKGTRLFTLGADKESAMGPTQGVIVQALNERLKSYERSIEEYGRLTAMQSEDMARRLVLLEREIVRGEEEERLLVRRLALSRKARERFAALEASGFVAPAQTQQKEENMLAAAGNLAALARGMDGLRRERTELRAERDALPLRRRAREMELRREAEALKQDLAASEAQREVHVLAPEDGTVASLTAQPGSPAGVHQPLAILVPRDGVMEAHLFAPSRAIGFIRPGARVELRFEAFPFQKFGHARGTVTAVSATALLPGELSMIDAREPLYRIRVALARPFVRAYGRDMPLLPSMRVEGDILLESRRLFEWVLEPLYSITGKWGG
ncbi:HlyD family secretion protein [Paludibacterium paludis]|uniref:Secretion protein n=1 Tax=Paludibacterium paludis TaxID=1225769 RepID=A0A918P3L3_9NEIS|nr:HlyD family efflux transporter periplasmic adaptor subunit [Paludibacterium paludis]GGY17271.1 secretion protein [Paludibacterium paludis]